MKTKITVLFIFYFILILILIRPVSASYEASQHEKMKGWDRALHSTGLSGLMTDYNIELMAHLVYGESGSDWCTDQMQQYVASVAVNRVYSGIFPNTLESVIYQRGQYQCTWDGNFYKTPDDRAYKNAKFILKYGSRLPKEVVCQSEIRMPKIFVRVQNMYFGYRW